LLSNGELEVESENPKCDSCQAEYIKIWNENRKLEKENKKLKEFLENTMDTLCGVVGDYFRNVKGEGVISDIHTDGKKD
jgi:hypothetical protein